jgi:predicted ABC-type ATPase
MPHALDNLLDVRKDAQALSNTSLATALLRDTGDSDAALMVKNVLAAEAVSRGLDADDPAIDFPAVMLACGEADHGVIGLLPEAMREKAMGAVVAGSPLPLEVLVANHGFEMRLQPQDDVEMPSITNRVRRVVERVLGNAPSAPVEDDAIVTKAETFSVPVGVQKAATRAREWMRENADHPGATINGAIRANQLASGEPISLATVEKMYGFFASYAPDRETTGFLYGESEYPSAARVAWDSWGGDAAANWVVESFQKDAMVDSEYDPMPLFNERQKAMYSAYETIDGLLGPWNAGSGADGAHYMEDNPFAETGMMCANCAMYKSPGGCEILDQPVNAMGVCKLWIIPESLIGDSKDVSKYNRAHDKGGRFAPRPGGGTPGDKVGAIIGRIEHGQGADIEPGQVGEAFSRMARGQSHPDVTELSVAGTHVFGQDGLGYSRPDMPQIPESKRGAFMGHLNARGITTIEERVNPQDLNPVQSEISGRTSGRIYEEFKAAGHVDESQRIIISKDNYVIDGHHTWAASTAYSFEKPDLTIPVYRVNADHDTTLREAHAFADRIGSPRQAFTGGDIIEKFNRHHDRRGRFASAPGTALGGVRAYGSYTIGGRETAPEATFAIDGPIRGATGGFHAGIPTKISAKDSPIGEDLSPQHSIWHHMEKNPDYSGKPGESKYRITPERTKQHQKIIDDAVKSVPRAKKGERLDFVMLGGGPASGKSHGLKHGAFPGVRTKDKAVHINADDVKGQLPEFDALRFSAQRYEHEGAAGFVHEESSYLAKQMQKKAFATRRHVVLDGTGDSSPESLGKKITQARDAGYYVRAAYATVPTNMAWDRARKRATGTEKRFVKESIVRGTHKSVSQTLPEAVRRSWFDDVTLSDTSAETPRTILTQVRGQDAVIVDPKGYQDFLAKGNE